MVNALSRSVTFKTLGFRRTVPIFFFVEKGGGVIGTDSDCISRQCQIIGLCSETEFTVHLLETNFFMLIGYISVVRWLNALFFPDYSRLVPGNHGFTLSSLWAKVTTQEKSEFESSERFHFSFHFVCSVIMYASYIATCFIFLRQQVGV